MWDIQRMVLMTILFLEARDHHFLFRSLSFKVWAGFPWKREIQLLSQLQSKGRGKRTKWTKQSKDIQNNTLNNV